MSKYTSLREEIKDRDPELYATIMQQYVRKPLSHYMTTPNNKSEELDMRNHLVNDELSYLMTPERVLLGQESWGNSIKFDIPRGEKFFSMIVRSRISVQCAALRNHEYVTEYARFLNPGRSFQIKFSKPVHMGLSACYTPGSCLILEYPLNQKISPNDVSVTLELGRDFGMGATHLFHQNNQNDPRLVFPLATLILLE